MSTKIELPEKLSERAKLVAKLTSEDKTMREISELIKVNEQMVSIYRKLSRLVPGLIELLDLPEESPERMTTLIGIQLSMYDQSYQVQLWNGAKGLKKKDDRRRYITKEGKGKMVSAPNTKDFTAELTRRLEALRLESISVRDILAHGPDAVSQLRATFRREYKEGGSSKATLDQVIQILSEIREELGSVIA